MAALRRPGKFLILRSSLAEWIFLLGDDRKRRGEFRIQFGESGPFLRHIVFMEDRFDGTFGHARFAVDAFFRMNVDHLLAFVETLDWANDHTVCVFAGETGLSNDVSHDEKAPFEEC